MEDLEKHWRSLEAMYLASPINTLYPPQIIVSEGEASISIAVDPQHFHAMGSLHGSVYFKLLDDSAVFAAMSKEFEYAVYTASFTCKLRAPVSEGRLTAVGKITQVNGRKVTAQASITDEAGTIVATGEGLFVPSHISYSTISSYS